MISSYACFPSTLCCTNSGPAALKDFFGLAAECAMSGRRRTAPKDSVRIHELNGGRRYRACGISWIGKTAESELLDARRRLRNPGCMPICWNWSIGIYPTTAQLRPIRLLEWVATAITSQRSIDGLVHFHISTYRQDLRGCMLESCITSAHRCHREMFACSYPPPYSTAGSVLLPLALKPKYQQHSLLTAHNHRFVLSGPQAL